MIGLAGPIPGGTAVPWLLAAWMSGAADAGGEKCDALTVDGDGGDWKSPDSRLWWFCARVDSSGGASNLKEGGVEGCALVASMAKAILLGV